MALTLDGTTGVSALQAGTVESGDLAAGAIGSGDLPAGSVIQVVSASTTTTDDLQTTSYVDTSLSCSITPTSATSKILVLVDQMGAERFDSDGSHNIGARLLRGATAIGGERWVERRVGAGSGGVTLTYFGVYIKELDSPNTTSSVTYKTQARVNNISNSGRALFQVASGGSNETSTMILMEIAG